MSLVARLYLLVALAVLPAIGIQLYNELTLRKHREAQVRDEALRLAEFSASELNGVLAGARTLLVSLSSTAAVLDQDAVGCQTLMEELDPRLPQYAALGAAKADGTWFCATGALPSQTITPTAERTSGADDGSDLLVGSFAHSGAGGRALLPITLPVRDPSGRVTGYVGLGLDLHYLQLQYLRRPMPPGASISVVDREGTLIVRVPNAELIGQPMRDGSRWILNADRAGTLVGPGPDDVDRIVGYVPPAAMVGHSLGVSVGLSAQNAMQAINAAQRRGLVLIAAGLLLALAAARVAGRLFILRPIEALLRAAARWRAGDFSARVHLVGQRSEFSRLGDAFDGMAASFEAHEREMRATTAALQVSEARFRQFAENSHDVLWIFDRRVARFDYLSPAFAEIWGRPAEEVLAGEVNFLATLHPNDRERAAAARPAILAGEQVVVTYRVVRPDGTIRWVRDSGFPIRDDTGAIIRAGGICRDITVWKAIEQERERTLAERELMLREINHRVKNNLQVMTSLLRLQASRGASQEIRDAFEEACGRVSTITELHVGMFHGAQVGTLDFGTYLHELCRRLEATLADVQSGAVQIHVEAEAGPVDLDRAVPLGLIVNELVSNATKHGFADSRQGSVEVRFHRIDGVYRLRVWDEGPGSAMSGTAILQQGLGQQLIEGLVRRIKGCLVIGDGPGFEATVEFPADLHAGKAATSQP